MLKKLCKRGDWFKTKDYKSIYNSSLANQSTFYYCTYTRKEKTGWKYWFRSGPGCIIGHARMNQAAMAEILRKGVFIKPTIVEIAKAFLSDTRR